MAKKKTIKKDTGQKRQKTVKTNTGNRTKIKPKKKPSKKTVLKKKVTKQLKTKTKIDFNFFQRELDKGFKAKNKPVKKVTKKQLKELAEQKSIKIKLAYQNKKLKEIAEEYKIYRKRNPKKLIKYEGRKRSEQTIANLILEKSKAVNNEISELESKLKIKTKNQLVKKKNYKNTEPNKELQKLGRVWDRKDFDELINDEKWQTINGKNKDKQLDEIYSEADELFMRMNSKNVIAVLEDNNNDTLEFFLIEDFATITEENNYKEGEQNKLSESKELKEERQFVDTLLKGLKKQDAGSKTNKSKTKNKKK